MRTVLALGLLATSMSVALAQPAAKSTGPETRYFTSIDGLMDGNADTILKETRQGRAVTSAVLDVCYPAAPGSERKDRFVVNLAASGQSLTGTSQSIGDKLPVKVQLTRKAVDGRYDFAGEITVGQTTNTVESTDNPDMSESEFQESRTTENEIISSPRDFTEASPEALIVKVKLDAVPDFLKSLKGQDIEVNYDSIVASCDELRAGEQIINLNVDPLRSVDLLNQLKNAPGVVAVGWTTGNYDIERTIRFAEEGWRDGGKLNRDKIATTAAEALKKALGAQSASGTWDEALGRLIVTIKRPSHVVAGLGLTENLSVTMMVAPDKPVGSKHLLLWLNNFSSTVSDDSSGSKLRISDTASGEEEGSWVDDSGTVAAMAGAFKAQRWNAEQEKWD